MNTIIKTITDRVPNAVAVAITNGVREEVRKVFEGPIKNHVTDFLQNGLVLSEGDFFLLLASMQPDYNKIMMDRPAYTSGTEATEPGTGAVEMVPDNTPGVAADNAPTQTPGNNAQEAPTQTSDNNSQTQTSDNNAPTAFDVVLETARNTAEQSANVAVEKVPVLIKELFEDNKGEEGKKLLREAMIRGFRDILKGLAKDKKTKDEFLNALADRIRKVVVDGEALKDDKVFADIVRGAHVLTSSVDTCAESTIKLFESLKKRTDADADRSVAQQAVERQDAELEKLHKQLKDAHDRIASFLNKDKQQPKPEPESTTESTTESTSGGTSGGRRRARSVRRGRAQQQQQQRRRRRGASRRRGPW